jgi:uncharacterized protein (DUF433 family)
VVQFKAIDPQTRTCVIRDAAILGGTPVVSGTRVPAATIVAYLRDGHTASDILGDFPSLPTDGINAVENWADQELGPTWRLALPAKSA